MDADFGTEEIIGCNEIDDGSEVVESFKATVWLGGRIDRGAIVGGDIVDVVIEVVEVLSTTGDNSI